MTVQLQRVVENEPRSVVILALEPDQAELAQQEEAAHLAEVVVLEVKEEAQPVVAAVNDPIVFLVNNRRSLRFGSETVMTAQLSKRIETL